MRVRIVPFTACVLAMAVSSAFSGEIGVASPEELSRAIESAPPGTTITITATGELDWPITVNRSGTADTPIVIEVAEPDTTAFVLSKPLVLKGCAHVVSRGMHFRGCRRGAVTFDGASRCRVTECRFTECTKENIVRFTGAGRENRLDHCTFTNNAVRNVSIYVADVAPRDARIDHNLFEDVPPKGGNGRETIQIGQNQRQYGRVDVGAVVEFNEFRRCNGEGEIISNKSSGNTYRKNCFIECAGELVMRGGTNCVITGNRFERCFGGIRLSGNGHVVTDNVVWDSRYTGIRLCYGMSDEPPAFYPAVYDCIIANNTIVNAQKAGILIGDARGNDWSHREEMASNPEAYGENLVQNIAPHDNRLVNNLIVGVQGTLIETDGVPNNIIERTLLHFTGGAEVPVTGEEPILADPVFVDPEAGDFRLTPGSPARNAGMDWRDCGSAPDLGADGL